MAPLVPLLLALAVAAPADDPRDLYDVLHYDLHFAVAPEERRLDGLVRVRARVVGERLSEVVLDMQDHLEALAVSAPDGSALAHRREEDRLIVALPEPLAKGAELELAVRYGGSPRSQGDFAGFHWKETADGRPWIGTSCQGLGASYWWPCKASFFNPGDKPEGVEVELVVPAGLYGVSNGRLRETVEGAPAWYAPEDGEWTAYRWHHPYPLETYTVTLNVAPYVVVEQQLEVEGIDEPFPFVYYVLPENEEKAEVQFAEVPRLVEVYSKAFGPFPFPESKFGLVETSFWGMEHSTAVAYGSSYPAWCEQNGKPDRYARRNEYFDYILIHEVAHEWWGNAVSAEDWGHFWIHEGFGTYAEGVYVEMTQGRELADEYFAGQARRSTRAQDVLWRGDDPDSRAAYAGVIYSKGACVLNTLRHYVADDEAWWKSLREFNVGQRYGNATTEDFRAVLERNTGRSWERFFQEWFYGAGAPRLEGTVDRDGSKLRVAVAVAGDFHVPLDLAWAEGGARRQERVWLEPGENKVVIDCSARPRDLELVGLQRVLGRHEIEVSE